MKAEEIKTILAEYLRQTGTNELVQLVSDAITEAGGNDITRENFARKLVSLSRLDLHKTE